MKLSSLELKKLVIFLSFRLKKEAKSIIYFIYGLFYQINK